MISIDEQPPPDLSSSDNQTHRQQQQESHEAFASDIDLLKPTAANRDDVNIPLPNFSIRDYVFESRSKNLAGNWPFSGKSFQLCLNYGVKSLLPPFQSLDSVRNYSSSEETISRFDSKRNGNPQCQLEDDLAHKKSNSQPTVMKCKLVMKLNPGVEPVDESSGSKVCPVCKTFSSSSNTTLNAHIDQCLSEESGLKPTADVKLKTVITKHRIKPRKKRLMVDVYKTAPHCTIEELDRRNGTNWATNSSFPDQELEFQAEEKTKQSRDQSFLPVVADHEGAVYIDKNGKKVRILSMPKFSNLEDVDAAAAADDDEDDDDDEAHKGRKGSKAVIKKKKKAYEQKNGKNILKLSLNSKKLSKKAASGQKENVVNKESCKKAQVNEQMDDVAITRPPWACSKRTGGSKKRVQVRTERKEGTLLDCSYESPIGSKVVKLKRKFTSPEKSQDSLKWNSSTEEDQDSSKRVSFQMVNVTEAKKKISTTSESISDDSCSGGFEISSKSARSHEDGDGMEQSFMGKEFSRMISQLDNKFDPRERMLDDVNMDQYTEKQRDYSYEVDRILIPGPPGSFLPPSPGADMGSEEEPQPNSSLTTMSRVQSSEEYQHHRHHDHIINQDFVSGSSVSTVSSPSFARTARFDTKSMNNNNNTSDLRSVDAFVTEKGLTPCCCSKNIASYHQLSPVFKEQATESNGLRSKLFPLVNQLTLPPYEAVKPPVVSPTTPVLRLMGKNLTVVNTDDRQVQPPCSSPTGPYHQLQKLQNENHQPFFYGYKVYHPRGFS